MWNFICYALIVIPLTLRDATSLMHAKQACDCLWSMQMTSLLSQFLLVCLIFIIFAILWWIALSIVYTQRWWPCLVCNKHRSGSQVSQRLGGPGRHSWDLHRWEGCMCLHLAQSTVWHYISGLAIDLLLKIPSMFSCHWPTWSIPSHTLLDPETASYCHQCCQPWLCTFHAKYPWTRMLLKVCLICMKERVDSEGDHLAFKLPWRDPSSGTQGLVKQSHELVQLKWFAVTTQYGLLHYASLIRWTSTVIFFQTT